MYIIFKIAKAELKSLFYAPIAWVIIVVFFLISGMQFVDPLMTLARIQEVKLTNNPAWRAEGGQLTKVIFIGSVEKLLSYFYLFIPLLTMGIIGRERNTGTIKLLYSSPIQVREIVLGKYLGLILFNLILLSSVALLLLTGYFSIEHAELYWLLSMWLGFFFLSAVYVAIGLYISCLISNQIVAALTTFILFSILGIIGSYWQDVDVLRDMIYVFDFYSRSETLIKGLITTSDIIYLFLIVILFLWLSINKLKSTQESTKWIVRFSRNASVVLLIFVIGYFSNRPGYIGYWDVTRDKVNTIDPATQEVLKELDGSPMTVTLYTNLFGANKQFGDVGFRKTYIRNFWGKIGRFYPNLHLKYEFYYDLKKGDSTLFYTYPNLNIHQIAEKIAKFQFINLEKYKKPGEIDQLVDLSGEDLRAIMELEYKGKKAFLRTVVEPGDVMGEEMMSGTFRRLARDTTPMIYFTSGHYERSPYRNGEREYRNHTLRDGAAKALVNLGVDVDTISLLNASVPANTSILAVADPRSALSPKEQEKVMEYLEAGGNAVFLGEPGKQSMLNPILEKIGVHLEAGILVRPMNDMSSELFRLPLTPSGYHLAKELYMQFFQQDSMKRASQSFFSNCVLSYKAINGFKIEPIVQEVPVEYPTWIEKGQFVSDSAAPTFSITEGDLQQSQYVIGLKMSRIINNKEQRIIVMGDADCMASRYDKDLIGNGLYSWLLNNEYPVYTRVIDPLDNFLTISKQTGIVIYNLYMYVIPGLLILIGAVVLIRRKRK